MIIQTREGFEHARTVLIDADTLIIDTETYRTDLWHKRKLLGIAVHCPVKGKEELEVSFYFPFGHEPSGLPGLTAANLPVEWLQELAAPLSRTDCEYVFHNAKFDIQILWKNGIPFPNRFDELATGEMYDTMIITHMIDENATLRLKDLNKLIFLDPDADREEEYINKIARTLGGGDINKGWHRVPIEVMGTYACKDVWLTYRLWKYLMPLLVQQEMTHLWEWERDFCLSLAEVEMRGIGIQTVVAAHFAEQAEARMQEILARLGYDPLKKDQLASRLFGVPPLGLGLVPGPLSGSRTKLFPQGIPIMDKERLSTYLRYCPEEISLVLEYRTLSKAVSTWFRGFLRFTDYTHRVHPNYKQHGTLTTRISCSYPNMNQLPRYRAEEQEEGITKTQVKLMLNPKPGYEVWEADYLQIEYRLAAIYGEEEEVIEAYRRGSDFHQVTADKLGIPRDPPAGSEKGGKTFNFAALYGAQAEKLAWLLGVSLEEGKFLFDEYWSQYPSLLAALERSTQVARHRGYVRLWNGRRRHFRGPWEAHKAFNSLIQGGAAQIMTKTMVKIHRGDLGPESKIEMVGQVYDSLWVEIPIDRVETDISKLKELMEWPTQAFNIPFPVDVKKLAPLDAQLSLVERLKSETASV